MTDNERMFSWVPPRFKRILAEATVILVGVASLALLVFFTQTAWDLRTVPNDIVHIKDRMVALESSQERSVARLNALEVRMAALAAQMTVLSEQMAALSEQMTALSVQMATLSERFDAFEARMDRFERRAEARDAAFLEFSGKSFSNEARIDRLQRDAAFLLARGQDGEGAQ